MTMMSGAVIARLLAVRDEGPEVLSVYLTLPKDPDHHAMDHVDRALAPIRALLARQPEHRRQQGMTAALEAVRAAGTASAGDWYGRSVAMFASAELGVFETLLLNGPLEDIAVLRAGPYVGPLLARAQRRPVYLTAIVDERQAWVLRVGTGVVHELAKLTPASPHGAGGHLAEAVVRLVAASATDATQPVLLGGHPRAVAEFLTRLPGETRKRVIGAVTLPLGALSVSQIRATADPLVARWRRAHEDRLLAKLSRQTLPVVSGLSNCLRLAEHHSIDTLLMPEGLRQAGFICPECRSLAIADAPCRACRAWRTTTPDVAEDLAVAVLTGGGRVEWIDAGSLPEPAVVPRSLRLGGHHLQPLNAPEPARSRGYRRVPRMLFAP